MSTWGELLEAGYSRVLGCTIEGIPYAFIETRLKTTSDSDIGVPADYTSAPASLRVRDAGPGVPESELALARELSYSETFALGKEQEEARLYADMEADIAQQVLRRLGTVRL